MVHYFIIFFQHLPRKVEPAGSLGLVRSIDWINVAIFCFIRDLNPDLIQGSFEPGT